MTLRLAHLSDLHFGEAPPPLVESLADDLAAAAPDAILVSGDLTRRAEPAEFTAATAFLRRFDKPVLIVPGNHDIPRLDLLQRFLAPRRRWHRAEMGALDGVLDLGAASVIGVDTVSRAQWHLDWSAGGIGPQRMASLGERLRAASGRPIIVMCHHPLRHPDWAIGRQPPKGARTALGLLREAGARAVLSGHLHRADGLGEGPRQFIAPSALSPRLKPGTRNGWLLLVLDEQGLHVEAREQVDGAWQARAL
jgi:3',5'-cyclic AMP phosphodiesterase CpdA